jgi:uncharacterized protein with HEPN domain
MSDAQRLADIQERILRIERATAGGKAEFFESEVLQDAVIRNLEVIGEAAKSLSPAARKKHPRVNWRGMGRFRDLAIHHYGSVLVEEVWKIVERDLPALKQELGR